MEGGREGKEGDMKEGGRGGSEGEEGGMEGREGGREGGRGGVGRGWREVWL